MRAIKQKIIYTAVTLVLSLGLSISVVAADFTTTETLAKQGNASAQYELGEMYNSGEGAPQDGGKAAEWFTKAAQQDNVQAQVLASSLKLNERRMIMKHIRTILSII